MSNLIQLGEVAQIFNGRTPSRTEQRDAGHPVLKIRDVSAQGRFNGAFDSYVDPTLAAKYSEKHVALGDTLLLNAAHNADYVGSKAYFAEPDVVGSLPTGEWLVVRAKRHKADPHFLHYWITSRATKRRLRDLVKGIHLYPKDVTSLTLRLPALLEQQRIATILNKADNLRRKRQEAIRLADEFLRAVFIDMFGSPDQSSKWSRSSVANMVARIESGWSTPSSDLDLTVQDLAVLKVSAVSTGWFLPNEAKVVDRSIVDRPLVFPRRGDLLFSRANTRELVAACCLVEEDVENRFLPDKLWRITAEPKRATNEYLCYLFRHPAFRHELTKQATGTSGSMLNISQAKLLSTSAPMPPIALQEKFSKIVQRSLEGRRNLLRSLRDLESLKESLSAELLS